MDTPEPKKGVSAVVACSVISFGIGIAVGIGLTMIKEAKMYNWYTPLGPSDETVAKQSTIPAPDPKLVTGPKAPAVSRARLVALVVKLDELTAKPLVLNLTDDQKKKIREQIDGLDAQPELSEEDAKKRLDAVLDAVQGEKETLAAAGYTWPGQSENRLPADGPNPFKDENTSKRLKSLSSTLGKVGN